MDLELPEAAGEGHVLVAAEGLVAEEQHLVVGEGAGQVGDDLVVEVGGQVDVADLAAEGGAEETDREAGPLEGEEALALIGQVADRAHRLLRRVLVPAHGAETGAGVLGGDDFGVGHWSPGVKYDR